MHFLRILLPLALVFTSMASAQELASCESQLDKTMCMKIGQMLIVGFGGLKQDQGKVVWQDPNGTHFKEGSLIATDIQKHHIGGIILFQTPFFNEKTGVFLSDRNIQCPQQLRELVDQLQGYNAKVNNGQHLPLMIGIDEEGGLVDHLPMHRGFKPKLVTAHALGYNEELTLSKNLDLSSALLTSRMAARNISQELSQLHINVNFAPCVDVNINPMNPIIGSKGRSFSANPKVVFDQAEQFILGLHDNKIIATLKHFPGHGASEQDSHLSLVNVTKRYQKDKELYPYLALIKNGYQDMIMTTHVINGQLDTEQCKQGSKKDPTTWCPATLSKKTLTNLLREQLGFKGVVVSDEMTMAAIAKEYSLDVALSKAINAGVDMFILSNRNNYQTDLYVNTIASLVKNGQIKASRINEAFIRISTLKKKLL